MLFLILPLHLPSKANFQSVTTTKSKPKYQNEITQTTRSPFSSNSKKHRVHLILQIRNLLREPKSKVRIFMNPLWQPFSAWSQLDEVRENAQAVRRWSDQGLLFEVPWDLNLPSLLSLRSFHCSLLAYSFSPKAIQFGSKEQFLWY